MPADKLIIERLRHRGCARLEALYLRTLANHPDAPHPEVSLKNGGIWLHWRTPTRCLSAAEYAASPGRVLYALMDRVAAEPLRDSEPFDDLFRRHIAQEATCPPTS